MPVIVSPMSRVPPPANPSGASNAFAKRLAPEQPALPAVPFDAPIPAAAATKSTCKTPQSAPVFTIAGAPMAEAGLTVRLIVS